MGLGLMLLTLLGLVGSALFGAACVPMAAKAIRQGSAEGIPTSSIWLFTGACITFFGYLFFAFGFHLPFVIGIIETACWLTVMRYRYWPRGEFEWDSSFVLGADEVTAKVEHALEEDHH